MTPFSNLHAIIAPCITGKTTWVTRHPNAAFVLDIDRVPLSDATIRARAIEDWHTANRTFDIDVRDYISQRTLPLQVLLTHSAITATQLGIPIFGCVLLGQTEFNRRLLTLLEDVLTGADLSLDSTARHRLIRARRAIINRQDLLRGLRLEPASYGRVDNTLAGLMDKYFHIHPPIGSI